MPDISLVRLETKADVSEGEEFCLAKLGRSPILPTLAALAETLRGVLGDKDAGGTPCPRPIEMGLELLELLQASLLPGPAGLADRDALLGVPGVPGGVIPLPLALLAPITLTSSFTETPCSSGGISLLNGMVGFLWASPGDDFRLEDGGLADLEGLFSSSPLNHFWKKDFRSTDPALPRGNVGELGLFPTPTPPTPTAAAAVGEAPCLGGVVGLTGRGRLFLL